MVILEGQIRMVFNRKAVVMGMILFIASVILFIFALNYYVDSLPKTNARVTQGVSENTYHPPMQCYVSVEIKGAPSIIYLDVTGLNSTVFCRRLMNDFDLGTVTELDKPSPLDSMCVVNGEGFSISVSSISEKSSKYICRILIGNSVNA